MVEGEIIVGKDVGTHPIKYLRCEGPGGKLTFDLVNYHVYHEKNGRSQPIVPLHENWIRFMMKEILEGRRPVAVDKFRVPGAIQIIEFLETWRDFCRVDSSRGARSLCAHKPGADVSELRNERYRVYQGGKAL